MSEGYSKDSGDVRPSSLRHMIGQQHVIELVASTLDYCFQDGVAFPHSLCLGPPGLGKTCMATVLSQEVCGGFHEILASAISSPSELFAVLLKAADQDIVFVEEIHCLDRLSQHTLLVALDEGKIYLPNGSGGAPQAIRLGKFTLIGCTTNEEKLIRPLLERFKLLLRFGYYTVAELSEIVGTRSKALGWAMEKDVPQMIAERSKGVPRLAIRILSSSWRFCRSVGDDVINRNHLERACGLEQIDSLGLDATEQAYLRLLANNPLRLNMLASCLGLGAKTISSVTETFLIRAGLITKDKQGLRMLTGKGMEHVKVQKIDVVEK